MKILMIKVTNCAICPLDWPDDCDKQNFDDLYSIPEDCPLPDVDLAEIIATVAAWEVDHE